MVFYVVRMVSRQQTCLGGREVNERVALDAECATEAARLQRKNRQVHLGIGLSGM